ERHYLIVSLLTWLVATAALSVLILLGLDGLQMRGSLLEYSFSKGHVVYLPGVTALNNTLLLHDDVDSVTFGFEAGVHTKTITLRLEHPQMQLNDSEKVVLFSHRADSKLAVPAGEYPLNLPAGPLYARIIVEAESRLKIPPTQYTFHVLRVGEALALSLSGEVATPQEDAPGRRVPFQESRRWLYQQRHAEWYVPKLEENSSVSLQVELRPICFAPLKRAQHERRSHFSSYSEECLCGDEVAGLGTNCILEKKIPLNSTPVCLFLHDTTDRMRMDDSKGSLSGTDRKLVKWLQDVRISGRFAGLRSDPSLTELEAQNLQNSTTSDEEPVVWPLEVVNSSEFQISRFFRITKPAALLMQASQLLVATTPDDTDAEEQALPLKIVPHPPPVYLNVSGGMGMLLPEFSMNNRRSGYVICAVRDLTAVHGSTLDARFHVEEDVVRLSRDCSGELVEQKRFRAVRNDSCEYWDRYEPWSDNFDVAVTLSPEACLNEAIDLDIASAWKDAGFSHWSENMAKHHRKSCSALQRAVRLERVDVLPELLKHWDVNCDGCKETPLGAAASEGRMRSLKLLLHTPKVNLNVADEDGGTPLLRAAQHCQVAAVERLLENGSDVNALAPRRPRSKCLLTPLLWIAGHDACHEKQDSAAPMAGDASGNLSSLLTILAKGANHSTPAHDGCGQQTSLVEAINNIALPVVPLLLDLGASANEPGVMGPTDMDVGRPLAVLLSKFLQEKVGWDAFVAAFDLLLSKDANVNGLAVKDGSTVLIQAAKRCRPDVIKFLLKKGADPTIQAGQKKKRTAEARRTSFRASRSPLGPKVMRRSDREPSWSLSERLAIHHGFLARDGLKADLWELPPCVPPRPSSTSGMGAKCVLPVKNLAAFVAPSELWGQWL
ncbi:mask, partial [Symbiodinium sp. KB8]